MLILFIHLVLVFFIYQALSPIHFTPLGLFFLELLSKVLYIPTWVLFVLDVGNLFLLWLISRKIFREYSLLVPLIYAISPWSSYLVVAASFHIYLLFLLLIGCYGLLIIKTRKILGTFFVSGSIIGLTYSSLPLSLLLPLILLIPIFKIVSISYLKYAFVAVVILLLPLFFMIFGNYVGYKNILNNEVKVLSDPGLLNMVNDYQGIAQQRGLGSLAKISENKYLFSFEKILLKYLKQLTLANYFTSQEKLLNFSFTPPIFLGFLIPFIYGLLQLLKQHKRIFFLSTFLVMPSVFSRYLVDLNRLIIFFPVVIVIISYGLIELIKQKKKKTMRILLYLTLFLIVFQSMVTLFDISIREKDRFTKYYEFEKNYEVGKQ